MLNQLVKRVVIDLSQWDKKCGLTFNASKTVVLLFTKSNVRKKYEGKKLIEMVGQQIPFSDSVKYLVVTLDNNLTWKPHLEKNSSPQKTNGYANSNLRGMHAPKPKLSKWAYTGVVRPKLLYACMTWGNSINTIYQLKKLNRLAARSTTTITRNTPQASVEIMIDLVPI